jgi:hypothetical protein
MILQHTKHSFQTREITETEAWEILDSFLDCFQRNGITEVTLIYGYDWKVGDNSWKDQRVNVKDIRKHIKEEEKKESGYLGFDDLYIKIEEVVQVHFCYHSDLHLQYNQDDVPLINDLNSIFVERIGLKQ